MQRYTGVGNYGYSRTYRCRYRHRGRRRFVWGSGREDVFASYRGRSFCGKRREQESVEKMKQSERAKMRGKTEKKERDFRRRFSSERLVRESERASPRHHYALLPPRPFFLSFLLTAGLEPHLRRKKQAERNRRFAFLLLLSSSLLPPHRGAQRAE